MRLSELALDALLPTYAIYLFIKKSLFMFKHFIDLKAKFFEECKYMLYYILLYFLRLDYLWQGLFTNHKAIYLR